MARRWVWAVVAAAIVVIGMVAAVAFSTDPITAELNNLHKAGFPSTNEEIYALQPRKGTDAGPYYEKFMASHRFDKDPAALAANKELLLSSKLSDAQRDKDAMILRPYMKSLIEGSKADYLGLFSPGDGINLKVNPGSSIKLLCYLAAADARAGRLDQGLSELAAANRICAQIWSCPYFFEMTSALYRHNEVFKALQDIMTAHSSDAAGLQKCLAFVQSMPPLPDVTLGLKTECASFLLSAKDDSTIQWWLGSDAEPTAVDRWKDRLWYRPRIYRWFAFEVRLQRQALQSLPAGADWSQAEAAYEREYAAHAGSPLFFSQPLLRMFLDDIDGWGTNLARRRVALAALRIQLSRLRSGSYPSSLPSLGADGIDPFTGKALGYRLVGKGFVVWSVGHDRIDNGGARTLSPTHYNLDVVGEF